MKIQTYENKHYLQLKDHTFQVLNYFTHNYSDNVIWLQCTSNNKHGIVKEYLPDGWMLTKKRYSGTMIFTLFKKNFFNYGTTAENKGNMAFIAPTLKGARYLVAKWMLTTNGFDDSNINISKVVGSMDNNRHISRSVHTSKTSRVEGYEELNCVILHCGIWEYQGIESDIKRLLEEE